MKMREAEVRALLIDTQLRDIGWKPSQITREGVATAEQRSALGRSKPDYVLYREGSKLPLAVVEAKARGKDLGTALKQGLIYANKISCPVVFASDGALVLTGHISNGKPLMENNEEVREFLSEQKLLNYQNDRIWKRGEVVQKSSQLISIFNTANKALNSEGLANVDAFAEFSQVLFFKIVSEIADSDPDRTERPTAHWHEIQNRAGADLLDSYKSALKRLSKQYPGVFATQIGMNSPETLEKIVSSLNKYYFIDVKADIKGEAYEYFLRRYNTQKSDLAQYFTPRHIVSAMVAICDPRLGERIYDPFCGTGGFLVEAYKHLQKNMFDPSDKVLTKNRKSLRHDSVFGADISRTASAAKMNMILVGDGHSNITRCDSLKKDVSGQYDVVLTNIPFGLEHELDCVQHCLSAVAGKPNGRVCMIVPERILEGGGGSRCTRDIS